MEKLLKENGLTEVIVKGINEEIDAKRADLFTAIEALPVGNALRARLEAEADALYYNPDAIRGYVTRPRTRKIVVGNTFNVGPIRNLDLPYGKVEVLAVGPRGTGDVERLDREEGLGLETWSTAPSSDPADDENIYVIFRFNYVAARNELGVGDTIALPIEDFLDVSSEGR